MGNEADYKKTSPTYVEASPNGTLTVTTPSDTTSAEITTSVTNVAKAATRGDGAVVAEVYATAAANPTTSASDTVHAAITNATTLGAGKKPSAHMKPAERKPSQTIYYGDGERRAPSMPTYLVTTALARLAPKHVWAPRMRHNTLQQATDTTCTRNSPTKLSGI